MAIIKPFKAIRPTNEYVNMVAELPYDVMNREEAKQIAKNNKYSFLHIDRAEIDLDDNVNEHDEKVYLKAKENLDKVSHKNKIFKKNKAKDTVEEPTTKVCPFCFSEINIKATRCPHCTSDLTTENSLESEKETIE